MEESILSVEDLRESFLSNEVVCDVITRSISASSFPPVYESCIENDRSTTTRISDDDKTITTIDKVVRDLLSSQPSGVLGSNGEYVMFEEEVGIDGVSMELPELEREAEEFDGEHTPNTNDEYNASSLSEIWNIDGISSCHSSIALETVSMFSNGIPDDFCGLRHCVTSPMEIVSRSRSNSNSSRMGDRPLFAEDVSNNKLQQQHMSIATPIPGSPVRLRSVDSMPFDNSELLAPISVAAPQQISTEFDIPVNEEDWIVDRRMPILATSPVVGTKPPAASKLTSIYLISMFVH